MHLSKSGDSDALDKYIISRMKETRRRKQEALQHAEWRFDEQEQRKKIKMRQFPSKGTKTLLTG